MNRALLLSVQVPTLLGSGQVTQQALLKTIT